ncbi:amidohydrolase family protein [Nocardia sp. BMG111209]|uniref:amidohydrolase family protein n=1 Tax=Nocardia sp. BMG111209 TaxID=1160137 RepID=UPI0003613F0C|nr:amidohydrolase family protein [Nocardia sp. BMG111209]
MLIRNAVVFGATYTDVRWHGGRITECGTGLRAIFGEDDIDAAGGWLLPGLHDHHIHLRALAAQQDSVRVGPPQVRDRAGLAAALRRADAELPAGQWIRGVGYHEDPESGLDRAELDRLIPLHRPVRIQHRSGALWILNSAACRALGVDECEQAGVERDSAGRANGRLWRMDAWLGARLGTREPDLAAVAGRAAVRGITGFTDATPGLAQHEVAGLAAATADGRIPQRLHCMAPPGITDPGVRRFTLGPTKFLLDDATLPDLEHFADSIRAAHAAGRPVAVHCVTRVQLIFTMTALDMAGPLPGDRIEHGAIVPPEAFEWLRSRGVTVVTQPHFPVERAEQYAAEVDPADRPDLWRLGTLLAAGVPVAAGTDAPFGDADPWPMVAAAVSRTPEHSSPEDISLYTAISLLLGRSDHPAVPRTLEPGQPADLTLLRVPPPEFRAAAGEAVAATIVDGHPIHLAPN